MSQPTLGDEVEDILHRNYKELLMHLIFYQCRKQINLMLLFDLFIDLLLFVYDFELPMSMVCLVLLSSLVKKLYAVKNLHGLTLFFLDGNL